MNIISIHTFLFPVVLSLGLMACSKVENDYKALGFTDKTEMEVAFSKGYHTKQRLVEETAKVEIAFTAPKSIESDLTKFIERRNTCDYIKNKPINDEIKGGLSHSEWSLSASEACTGTDIELIALRKKYDYGSIEQKLKYYELITFQNFVLAFICKKKPTQEEQLYCSNEELVKLDVELSRLYAMMKEMIPDKQKLKSEQIEWMKSTRTVCSDLQCIVSAYKQRISELL